MEQVGQLADQYWTASWRALLQWSYLYPEPMEQAVQLADQYWTASSRVHLQQSYLRPERTEEVVQLADQYWTANSHGVQREFRSVELMVVEGRPKWLGCQGSPAACPK